jgi:hypothetical protein
MSVSGASTTPSHVDKHNGADGCRLFTIAQLGADYNMVRTSDAAWFGSTESTQWNQMEALVVEHDSEERTMHVQYAIPGRPAVIIDEPQFAEPVHEETDA